MERADEGCESVRDQPRVLNNGWRVVYIERTGGNLEFAILVGEGVLLEGFWRENEAVETRGSP